MSIDFLPKNTENKTMVIFDLDGTLVDSHTPVLHINRKVLIKHGANPEEVAQTTSFPTTFDGLMEMFHLSNIDKNQFRQDWSNEIMHHIMPVYPLCLEFLQSLQALSVPMAVWTARDRASAEKTLLENKINLFFEGLWTGEDFPSKPDKTGISFLANGRDPKDIHYFGDSNTDLVGAQNFGCHFYWIEDVFKKDFTSNFLLKIKNKE